MTNNSGKSGDRQRRDQIVLMPGLLCHPDIFSAQVAALSPYADVKVADFFGCDSMEDMAKRALGLFEGQVTLVGFSMGGRAAFQAIRMMPERIARLVLMDTGALPSNPEEIAKRAALVALGYAEGMGAVAKQWLPPMLHVNRENDPALLEPLIALVKRATPEIHDKQIKALNNRIDMRPYLSEIACPTLVMVGRGDRWSTVESHQGLAAAIPGAHLAIIEEAGHFITLEQPEAVNAALLSWFGYA